MPSGKGSGGTPDTEASPPGGKKPSLFLGVIRRGRCGADTYEHVPAEKRWDGTAEVYSCTGEPRGAPNFDPDEMYGHR